jgi:hypothetical protein
MVLGFEHDLIGFLASGPQFDEKRLSVDFSF